MDFTLSIDVATCIKCGKCAKVCPSAIIRQDSQDAAAYVNNPKGCVSCGHCVAVCPTESVSHSEFPPSKIHPIDYSQYPSAEQFLLLCRGRRSNRAMSKQPIPNGSLQQIVEAAYRAPTASNAQLISFTVISDPEKMALLSDFTIEVFRSMAKKLTNPFVKPLLKVFFPKVYRFVPMFERLCKAYDNGNDLVMRKATSALLIHSPQSNRFGSEDANLAYQNGSLMAECLGVSQFYTGFLLSAVKLKKGELEKKLGIDGTIHAGMALGMPVFRYPAYVDRKPLQATWN